MAQKSCLNLTKQSILERIQYTIILETLRFSSEHISAKSNFNIYNTQIFLKDFWNQQNVLENKGKCSKSEFCNDIQTKANLDFPFFNDQWPLVRNGYELKYH